MDSNEQRNLIIAVALSVMVMFGFQHFFGPSPSKNQPVDQSTQATNKESAQSSSASTTDDTITPVTAPDDATGKANEPTALLTRAEAISRSKRVVIDAPRLSGSVNLTGGRIDDLQLNDHYETMDKEIPVTLLHPSNTKNAYFIDQGWIAGNNAINAPGPKTQWTAISSGALSPDNPLVLEWDNGNGLTFRRKLSIDDDYLITVDQTVINTTDQDVTLYPYHLVNRRGHPKITGRSFILHQGPIGYIKDELHEIDYDDLIEDGAIEFNQGKGWMGITDKYWLTGLLPKSDTAVDSRFSANTSANEIRFQVDYRRPAVAIPGDTTRTVTDHLFVGAKEFDLLNKYERQLDIPHFDLAIDFGWYYFLTKPFFFALTTLGQFFANMGLTVNFGLAILAFTVLIRMLTFPVMNKAFSSMSQMKKLAPEMKKIRERYSDDREKLQKEIMELYQKEKVNPMSGCLLMLVQIPIFFALYKCIYITVDMRHAPFWGWVNDLSAPDPTTITNLFGLAPWEPMSFIQYGAWPFIYAVVSGIQQWLNPSSGDPAKDIPRYAMPLFFSYIFAKLPAGLVIYFAWSAALSAVQQYFIHRRMGVDPIHGGEETDDDKNLDDKNNNGPAPANSN